MDVSSLSGLSSSLQSLFPNLYSTANSAAADSSNQFSNSLQSVLAGSANSNSTTNGLALLQALQGYTSNMDPLLQALDANNSNNNADSLLNLADPFSNDSLLGSSNETGSLFGNSDTNTIDSLFDSNGALMQSLQKSGMSGTQMNKVLASIENLNSLSDSNSSLSGTSSITDLLQSTNNEADSVFNSNDALVQALQRAGVSSSDINKLLISSQSGTNYTQQGNLSTNFPNLFSISA